MRRFSAMCVALTLAVTTLVGIGSTSTADAADPADSFDPTLLDTEAQFARWGVVGKGPSSHADEDHGGVRNWTGPQPEVWDIEEHGDRVFVGGIFTGVRRNEFWYPNDPIHDQPFVAAFERDTGDWISTWRPDLDGVVYDVSITTDGVLLVGGEFTQVNGVARTGLVGLDPDTGQIVDTFRTSVSREWSDDPAYVKEIHVDGQDVYVAGQFSHVTDGSGQANIRSVVRLDATTGARDTSWNVVADGSVWDVQVDRSRDLVHLVGYFTSLDGLPDTDRMGTVRRSDGTAVAGLPSLPTNHAWNTDTVTVTSGNDQTWVGGGNHLVNVLDPATNQALFTQTVPRAGDIQVIENFGDWMALGHHGWDGGVAFFHAETYERSSINLGSLRRSYGIWALELTSDGCLWVGGDSTRTLGGAWLGGFGRFCPPMDSDGDGIGDQRDTVATTGASVSQAGTASQSGDWISQGAPLSADHAIDGQRDAVDWRANGDLAHTLQVAEPWWEVDLGAVTEIDGINIWNRTDCCTDRLDNAVVLIGDAPFGDISLAAARAQATWTTTIGDAADIEQLAVPGTVGRYVRIQDPDSSIVNLIEVDVFGTASNLPPFGTPPNVQLTTNLVDEVGISWDPVANVRGYVIHRDFQFLKWVDADTASFVDVTVAEGETYRYQVRAQAADNSYSSPSPIQSITVFDANGLPPFGTPANVSLRTNGTDDITVEWERVGDAKGYVIHRDYQFVRWVAAGESAWTDTGLVEGETYRYQVRAQAADNSYSSPSPIQSITVFDANGLPPFGTPANPTVTTNGIDSATISWEPVADAKGYVIHRDFQFLRFVPFTESSFVDTSAEVGRTYRYQVRAQAADNSYSAPTASEMITIGQDVTPPDAPEGVVAVRSADGTTVTVTWDPAVDDIGVTSYLIHDNWNYLAWVPAGTTSYTHTGLDPSSVHRYQIRARDGADNTSLPSSLVRVEPN